VTEFSLFSPADRIRSRNLRPGTLIRHAEVDGIQIILDLKTEAFYALDEVSSSMWTALTQTTDPARVLEYLHERFEVEPSRLSEDLDHFALTCLERGFLEENSNALLERSRPAPTIPLRKWHDPIASSAYLFSRALYSILSTRVALKWHGFRCVYENCISLPETTPLFRLDQASSAFLTAENLYVSPRAPNDCLLRSIALFRFLRRCGFKAEHLIGVRRVPFAVHAWVEIEGEPVLDHSSPRRGMTTIARIASKV
jgi:hypothetical protein